VQLAVDFSVCGARPVCKGAAECLLMPARAGSCMAGSGACWYPTSPSSHCWGRDVICRWCGPCGWLRRSHGPRAAAAAAGGMHGGGRGPQQDIRNGSPDAGAGAGCPGPGQGYGSAMQQRGRHQGYRPQCPEGSSAAASAALGCRGMASRGCRAAQVTRVGRYRSSA